MVLKLANREKCEIIVDRKKKLPHVYFTQMGQLSLTVILSVALRSSSTWSWFSGGNLSTFLLLK